MKFNKYSMIESGIGSNVSDLDSHLDKVYSFLNRDLKAEAMQEISNLRQCFDFIQQGININYMSFAVMIDSIDGKVIEDYSEEATLDVVNMLSKRKLSYGLLMEHLRRLKKKLKLT